MAQTNRSLGNRVRYNQRGASAIMFSLFFIMVISLISLGFATLVRNDQRATLDKTLSSQAQLAAESGVTAAQEYITAKGANLATSNPGLDKTNCDDSNEFKFPQFSNGARITCVTWDATPEEAKKTLEPYEAWTFVNNTAANEDIIQWQTDSGGALYGGAVGRRDIMPEVTADKLPIVKVVALSRTDITTPGKVEVFYLVPSVSPLAQTAVNLGDGGTNSNVNGNGAVFNVNCDGTTCKASITGYPTSGSRMYYIQLIGDKQSTVTYQSKNGGNLQQLNNVQAKVDVNVLAQDQSKRLISYVPLTSTPTTWQPFFAVLGDSLCKDMKVDGANNSPAPGSTGGVCPSN